jgi:hypothetical protein
VQSRGQQWGQLRNIQLFNPAQWFDLRGLFGSRHPTNEKAPRGAFSLVESRWRAGRARRERGSVRAGPPKAEARAQPAPWPMEWVGSKWSGREGLFRWWNRDGAQAGSAFDLGALPPPSAAPMRPYAPCASFGRMVGQARTRERSSRSAEGGGPCAASAVAEGMGAGAGERAARGYFLEKQVMVFVGMARVTAKSVDGDPAFEAREPAKAPAEPPRSRRWRSFPNREDP